MSFRKEWFKNFNIYYFRLNYLFFYAFYSDAPAFFILRIFVKTLNLLNFKLFHVSLKTQNLYFNSENVKHNHPKRVTHVILRQMLLIKRPVMFHPGPVNISKLIVLLVKGWVAHFLIRIGWFSGIVRRRQWRRIYRMVHQRP